MKTKLMALCALLTVGGALRAEEPPVAPEMPKPTTQHEWLNRFVGEWTVETEAYMAPDQEPVRGKGTESVRSLGGFWVVSEGAGEMMEMKMNWILTFGYDPAKKVYVGTWIDSMTSQKWEYEGTVEESGKVLSLTTRGFCPVEQKICNFRSTVEFKSDDVRVLTEKKEMADGTWATAIVSTSTRKK
jgi:hypothetical protein